VLTIYHRNQTVYTELPDYNATPETATIDFVVSCAQMAEEFANDLEFLEEQLSDEGTFMLFNFPSAGEQPSDEAVAERYEEVLELWVDCGGALDTVGSLMASALA
jgi:hypothetical protein